MIVTLDDDIIRLMEEKDLDDVLAIEKEVFASSPWKKEDFLYELNDNPYASYLVLEIDHKLVGYIGLWLFDEQCQITNLAICKSEQGRGFSKYLMDKTVEIVSELEVKNINLEVRVTNNKAINLYQKYGFKQAAIRKNYYQDTGEDAYLMIKEMEG